MKKIILITIILSFVSISLYPQSEIDLYKLSSKDLTGTARTIGMSGASGTLGDIGSIFINPANIGLFNNSELATTFDYRNIKTNTDNFKESKSRFGFDNLSFVTGFNLKSDIAPRLNFGFSYNKLKSFDRTYRTNKRDASSSLTDYMAYRANGYTYSELTESNTNNPWSNNWLAVQGLNTYLIKSDGMNQYSSNLGFYEVDNDLYVKEKGSISSYNFNIGTILYDKLSIGLTASYTNINYKMHSSYIEDFFYPNLNNHVAYFEQVNNIKMKGTGFQLGVGAIYQPIDELRLGVSYHSSTWYNMKDYYQSDTYHDLSNLIGTLHSDVDNSYKDIANPYKSPEAIYKYKLTTPDRWTFSAAGTIKNIVTISLDYELTNYRRMKEKNRHSGETNYNHGTNDFIKEDFKTVSTIRAGVEFNSIPYVPNLSVRVGYSFQESPMTKEMRNNEKEIVVIGANANYILDNHTNHYTFGLGYHFTKNLYADIAFVYKTQNSSLYNIPTVTEGTGENTRYITKGDRTELKTESFQSFLTLGYKFDLKLR